MTVEHAFDVRYAPPSTHPDAARTGFASPLPGPGRWEFVRGAHPLLLSALRGWMSSGQRDRILSACDPRSGSLG
jgi:hypothetical protein